MIPAQLVEYLSSQGIRAYLPLMRVTGREPYVIVDWTGYTKQNKAGYMFEEFQVEILFFGKSWKTMEDAKDYYEQLSQLSDVLMELIGNAQLIGAKQIMFDSGEVMRGLSAFSWDIKWDEDTIVARCKLLIQR